MARYMIQTSYSREDAASARIHRATMRAGAHFMANASLSVADGKVVASLAVEAANDRDAFLMVPPVFRAAATVTRLDGVNESAMALVAA
jgi:hypothetical protein